MSIVVIFDDSTKVENDELFLSLKNKNDGGIG
jgi:hypothetical protein